MDMSIKSLLPQIQNWLDEDDLTRNFHYTRMLPKHPVKLVLRIKSPLVLAGTDYLAAVFTQLGSQNDFSFLESYEAKELGDGTTIEFPETMPFNLAVTGERLALNLVQHASSIATWTSKHVDLAKPKGIKILDTRKTTPGLRSLEKYAVRVGGGFNHRLGQTDTWMVKDNHKTSLGGMKGALKFFEDQGVFYNNIVVEIHSIDELKEAISLGVQHVMLDNFSPDKIKEAVELKKPGMTFEASGGLNLNTIPQYLITGVDALSLGSLTYSAPRVDLSLKFRSV
ncbi:carboxylating nicotinate-nucleotide diphosphorylase [Peredibacter starrii]|uniref:nicotinate-nucleotide diphosphorylase (carboxylating) n=1 Tax=Peredibacter starrii TaxID=28202 RepID=A0AAX4HQW8_9BACT|nr:carboxylating nicotinate-nucleotide diphosphorylase [Peredibacter starrii]WPU65651.1 carboxylating nicotinate-nucleotide diphosphorylase [Peredibacter starrii]